MTTNDMVSSIRAQAASNKLFHLVTTSFWARKRSRREVSIDALKRRFDQLGNTYPRKAYESVFSTLAEFGVGDLKRDTKGKVRSLANIKYDLKSIGKVAMSTSTHETLSLKTQKPRFTILDMPLVSVSPKNTLAERLEATPAVEAVITEDNYSVVLQINSSTGKTFNFPGAQSLTSQQLGEIIIKFAQMNRKDGVV